MNICVCACVCVRDCCGVFGEDWDRSEGGNERSGVDLLCAEGEKKYSLEGQSPGQTLLELKCFRSVKDGEEALFLNWRVQHILVTKAPQLSVERSAGIFKLYAAAAVQEAEEASVRRTVDCWTEGG